MIKKLSLILLSVILVLSSVFIVSAEVTEPVNLFDKNHSENALHTLVYNGISDYNETDYVNIFATHYIPVNNGDVIYWGAVGSEAYIMDIFSSEKTHLKQVMRADETVLQLKTGNSVAGWRGNEVDEVKYAYKINVENAAFVRITAHISTMNELEVYTNLTDTEGWPQIEKNESVDLQDKKILFVGDSITYSSDSSGWPGRIADNYGAVTQNAGVSGASVSTAREDKRVIAQLTANKDNTYDYVIMHGGVNDAWDKVPVGSVSDSFKLEDFDISTYAGALEELFYRANEYYDGAKFGFIVNYSRPTASVEALRNMSVYFTEAKKVCEKWGISYFDMYHGTVNVDGVKTAISAELLATSADTNFIASGNVHISASGYDIITPYIAEWIAGIEHNNYHGTYDNPLAGKSALFLGDSITDAGNDGRVGWGGRIATANGMSYFNAGSSGATVSTSKTNRVLVKFMERRLNSYDYVIMHGGVNDAMTNTPVGEVSASFNVRDFDTSTYAGALEELFYNAYKYHGDSALGFIINYATPNSNWGGRTTDMSEYFDMAKKVCNKWNISYIDLYSGKVEKDGQLLSYSYDILKVDTAENMLDEKSTEVHISSKGYDAIAPYIADWMKTLEIPENSGTTVGEWAEQTPFNGDFEASPVGMDVYGWHLESMGNDGVTKYPARGYEKNYTFKTKSTENGKVAEFSKLGLGYAAAVSQKIAVHSGEEYALSFSYRKTYYGTVEGAEGSARYFGARSVIREYDADGNEILATVLRHFDNEVTTVSSAAVTYKDSFTVSDDTAYIAVCFWMGGQFNALVNAEFDNVVVKESGLDINGSFDEVTDTADGGRPAGVLGPAGWTILTANVDGSAVGSGTDYTTNFQATVVYEDDNPVMKLGSALASGYTRGYSVANSKMFKLSAGSELAVNYRMKVEHSGRDDRALRCIALFYDKDGNQIKVSNVNLGLENIPWTDKTAVFTAPENTAFASVAFWVGGIWDQTTVNFYIDDVELVVEGKKLGFAEETTMAFGVPRGDTNNYTPYWDINRVYADANHKNALVLSVTEGQQSYGGATFYSRPITVAAGKTYKLSFDYKLTGHLDIYSATNRRAYGGAFVIHYLDANGNRIDAEGNITDTPTPLYKLGNTDTVDWIASDVKEITVPANAVALQYGLSIGAYVRGTQDDIRYYFDNIVIKDSASYDEYAAAVRENANNNNLLSVSFSRGDVTTKDGTVSILDLVKMKRYADGVETVAANTLPFADMNANGVVSVDDIDLLRYRLLGFKKESDIKR